MQCHPDCICFDPSNIHAQSSENEAFLAFISDRHTEPADFSPDQLEFIRKRLSNLHSKLEYYEASARLADLQLQDAQNGSAQSVGPSRSVMEEVSIRSHSSSAHKERSVNGHLDVTCESPAQACSHDEYSLPDDDAENRIIYSDFVSQSNKYLCLRQIPTDDELLKDVNGPLGVCFDEVTEQWIIADTKNSRILMYPSCQVIETDGIGAPTAVCVVQPGVSFAILTANNAAIFRYNDVGFSVIWESDRLLCRGLAVTPNGNLLTIRKIADSIFLVVFSSTEMNKQLNLQPLNGNNPSFLHMIGNTLILTDLGNQSVTKCFLSDDDVNNVIFTTEVVHDGYKWSGETDEPQGRFNFVSGIQIDGHGRSLIGDAGGHTIQLFDDNLNPMYRVSADFKLPYMSAFAVNNSGEMMICGRQTGQLVLAKLGATTQIMHRKENPIFNRGPARGGPRGGWRGARGDFRGGRGDFRGRGRGEPRGRGFR